LPDFKKSWIVIIQGTEQAPGVCSYSLGFDEPVETATPKDFLMTAVDPTTCQFEFTVGIPTKVEPPGRAGMEHETSEDGSGSAQASAATALDSYGLGYISSEALALLFEGSADPPLPQVEAEGGIQLRYTVYAEWKDPANAVVNQVLSAVKAKVDNHNQLFDYHCRHDRWWWDFSGWVNRSSGSWDYEDCNKGTYSIKATTSGRFRNEDFPLCTGSDFAVVYYDRLSARATTLDSSEPRDWTFSYNIVASWADGERCDGLLHWAGFHTYPFEYNNLDPV
jgi:hypothetical protein